MGAVDFALDWFNVYRACIDSGLCCALHMEQLLTHLLGDFVLQSDWMALNKSKHSIPCLVHVLIYTFCFWLFITHSWPALLVLGGTHFLIDRFHIPLKRFIWLRGHLNPLIDYPPFKYCDSTGYYDDSPFNTYRNTDPVFEVACGKPRLFFISMWLYIAHDNFLHLTINFLALKYLT
jgi:hypothetical protein